MWPSQESYLNWLNFKRCTIISDAPYLVLCGIQEKGSVVLGEMQQPRAGSDVAKLVTYTTWLFCSNNSKYFAFCAFKKDEIKVRACTSGYSKSKQRATRHPCIWHLPRRKIAVCAYLILLSPVKNACLETAVTWTCNYKGQLLVKSLFCLIYFQTPTAGSSVRPPNWHSALLDYHYSYL